LPLRKIEDLTRAAFKDLFDTYFDAIRGYLYYRSSDQELSTDIAQEVFMKVWEKQMDIDNPGIKSLLYKMANEQFISQFRKKQTAQTYIDQFQLELAEDTPEAQMMYKELLEQYQSSLSELPEKQRTVFLMSRSEGLTYKEIAERLEISVKAIEKRMSLAINKLKQILQKEL
jgi:RNA polymerase sigma-70 factor (ECF subfamily)